MKTFLTLFVLLFSSSVLAEDISDFEIEGISIGNSLLDYFTEEEINNAIWYDTFKSKKFTDIEFQKSNVLKQYYSLHVIFKTKDSSFEIYGLTGTVLFRNDMTNCLKKLREVDSEIFPLLKNHNRKERNNYNHRLDPSGKSKITDIKYSLNSGGTIVIACFDWSQEMNYLDHLRVTIRSQDYDYFLTNEAY